VADVDVLAAAIAVWPELELLRALPDTWEWSLIDGQPAREGITGSVELGDRWCNLLTIFDPAGRAGTIGTRARYTAVDGGYDHVSWMVSGDNVLSVVRHLLEVPLPNQPGAPTEPLSEGDWLDVVGCSRFGGGTYVSVIPTPQAPGTEPDEKGGHDAV
jgi:hypothetical protein